MQLEAECIKHQEFWIQDTCPFPTSEEEQTVANIFRRIPCRFL